MRGLNGKTALVTGASRGIGRAIAERLAAEGALVAVHYGTNDTAAKETLAAIHQAGGQAFAVRAELGVDGDVDTLFAGLREGLGERPLDILVNNAAVQDYDATIEEATPEQYERVFAINVRAPLFITQRALALMPDGGRIINVSSGPHDLAGDGEHRVGVRVGGLAAAGLGQFLVAEAQPGAPRGVGGQAVGAAVLLGDQQRELLPEAGGEHSLGERAPHGQVAAECGRAVGQGGVEIGHSAELAVDLLE